MTAGFGAGMALFAAVGIFTLLTVSRLFDAYSLISHTEEVLANIRALTEAAVQAESGRRGYALTGLEDQLQDYASSVRAMRERLETLRRLTADNPAQQRRIAALAPLVEARISSLEQAIAAKRERPDDVATQARLVAEGRHMREEIRRHAGELAREEEGLLGTRRAEVTRVSRNAILTFLAGFAVSVALLATVFELLRRETARRVRAQREVDRFFALSLDPLCIADGGFFVRLNPAWERVLGYSEGELLGRPYLDFVHPDDLEETRARAKVVAEGEEIVDFVNRYRAKDGAWHFLEWNAAPDRESGLVYAAARDVTEERRTRGELESANRELEAFSYSVSHDLRAPLRGIDGFGQALVEDYGPSLDAGARGYIERIRAATKKMSALIDALLALSRVTRAELKQEVLDLSALAESAAADLRRGEPLREICVDIQAGLVVQGDQRLLRAALENLIGNAWKFTSKTRGARIDVFAVDEGGERVFHVRDNGAGFEMEYAEKLFGAFQRLHSPSEFAGTGIGLATVQRIVHRHGGRIWGVGAPGAGATFSFTLGGGRI
ncbi:MAG TPA: CHASE3 domain-containing protein [Thermoanaerobaculia bacterium]|nr:CHASE3 domain-containing protein [Thermoanaerobaculia bacterium]